MHKNLTEKSLKNISKIFIIYNYAVITIILL